MRYLFVLVAAACAAIAFAAEPPAIQSEPPPLVACECSAGAPCLCDSCECTVPVLASLPYDADHTCDRCGSFADVVERELPGGMHSHRCGSCGNEWYHADPGVSLPAVQYVAAPSRNPFASSDCANGNCPPRIVAGSAAAVAVRTVYGLERPRLFDGERRPVRRLLFAPFRLLRGGFCR